MQVDNDTSAQEAPEHAEEIHPEPSDHSRSNSLVEAQDPMEDTEGGGTIKTTDLLASEVAGSWACSTAPSVHGENDSPGRSKDDDEECAVPVHDSSSLVAESQHIPLTKSEADARRNHERRALSEMIGIVAPDLKEQFSRAVGSDDQVGSEKGVASDSDAEGCSDDDRNKDCEREEGCSDDDDDRNKDCEREASDAETIGSDKAKSDDGMDEDDDDDTQVDSVG
ncbi:hypothetical protein DH2020_025659 [Rehmannia glutinosa]|uniref:Uncharacterized protein n=1 Tax=Rehmannia glutinosa TaxID=99300 RepID=A0ABR0W3C0_REHGL